MEINPQDNSVISSRQRLEMIGSSIRALADAPLSCRSITLVAVSKTQKTPAIEALLEAGQRVFGENRVQEAMEKWPALRKHYPDIVLHLIGPLQTNKVKDALAVFDVIETIDRPSLIDTICKERSKSCAQVRCAEFFMQVNTGEEPQKGGILPRDAHAQVHYAHARGVELSGLMCVPPVGESPAPHFALLRKMAFRLDLRQLSMGIER